MAKISTVGPEAKERLQKTGKSYQERAPYREATTGMSADQMLELEPDAGETLRKLKVMMRHAVTEAGRDIQYGETEQGTLLVWIAEPTQLKRRRTRTT
jgi:serine protease inhibitor ecotin